jgi:protein-S-isoprenylcysteine O-methyltransferase Ste14
MDAETSKNESERQKPLSNWFILLLIPIYLGGLFLLLLFVASGDLRWREGWLFLGSFITITTIGYFLINRQNPEVLRNRSRLRKEGITAATRKSAGSDRIIFPLMGISFFGALILSSLDHRFGWSSVPFWISQVALVLTNMGNVILLVAMYQNAYASKILDISHGQRLIDTGLYSRIRHPLYAGGILLILTFSFALGSWWGVIPAVISALTLVLRIHFEEEMLVNGMEGYREYQKRVPYKLIPGVF